MSGIKLANVHIFGCNGHGMHITDLNLKLDVDGLSITDVGGDAIKIEDNTQEVAEKSKSEKFVESASKGLAEGMTNAMLKFPTGG